MDNTNVNVTNEVLAEKIDSLNQRFTMLQNSTEKAVSTYVSHEIFELRFRELDMAIKQVTSDQIKNALDIEKLRAKRLVPTLVTGTIVSVFVSAFTYLLYARLAL